VNDDVGSAYQYYPAISADSLGNFIVSWYDYRNNNYDIYAQRYSLSGTVVGANFKVNDDPGSANQYQPSITSDSQGNFIITWYDYRNGNYDIYAQRYNVSGYTIGSNFQVNDDTGTERQYQPSISSDSQGNFIITWYDYRNGDADIYAQRYDASGTVIGANFKVNDDPGTEYQYLPSIASDRQGNFIIAWYDYRNGDGGADIYAQRYNSSGYTVGVNSLINDDTTSFNHINPAVSFDYQGNYIISWEDYRNGDADVYAQRYENSGDKLGNNFLLSNTNQKLQILPDVKLRNGNIYNTWQDSKAGGTGYDIWANILDWNYLGLSTPAQVSPSDNTIGVALSPTLEWHESSRAISYTVQVSQNENFDPLIVDQSGLTETSFQLSALENYTMYYWRVLATNDYGESDWSPVWSFTTKVSQGLASEVTVTGSAQNAYRLISIPVIADDKTPEAVFSDFGAYNDEKWRLFELRADQKYYEFNDISEINLGTGYFLITNMSGKEINSGPGVTVRTDQLYSIPLNAGWTFIGNPFDFSVPISNLSLENGAALDIRTYEGNWEQQTTDIQPFAGYAVSSNSTTNLLIDPGIINTTQLSKSELSIMRTKDSILEIWIKAKCQEAFDTDNMLGVNEQASNGLDDLDRPEPPVIGEYVSVYFPHENWKSIFTKFSKDFRPENEDGYIWEFAVKTNIRDKVQLTFDTINNISDEHNIWLIDEVSKKAQNLYETNQYEIAGSDSPKFIKLIVGDQNFINTKFSELDLLPQTFILDQNYPNPFNPLTTIRFGIPSKQEVTLKIFNILGQEIITLLDKANKKAGYHTVVWDGKNRFFEKAASGVYLYSLETESFKAINKMVLIK